MQVSTAFMRFGDVGPVHWLTLVCFRASQPTLNPDSSMMIKDIVLLNRYIPVKAASGVDSFHVGDVVALTQVDRLYSSRQLKPLLTVTTRQSSIHSSPTDAKGLLIKRIIGMPGSMVKTLAPHPERSVRVPAGHCWVEGDERYHSRDSNAYGPVPIGLINARVDAIIWPPKSVAPLLVTLARKRVGCVQLQLAGIEQVSGIVTG